MLFCIREVAGSSLSLARKGYPDGGFSFSLVPLRKCHEKPQIKSCPLPFRFIILIVFSFHAGKFGIRKGYLTKVQNTTLILKFLLRFDFRIQFN